MNYLANVGSRTSSTSALWRKIDAQVRARAPLVAIVKAWPPPLPPRPRGPPRPVPEFNRDRHRECVRLRFRQVIANLSKYAELRTEMMEQEEARYRSAAEIISEVAAAHGVTADLICGPRRDKLLCRARFHAIYRVATERPDMSFPRMGKLFGNRDHTTILHAVRTYAKRNNLPLVRGLIA